MMIELLWRGMGALALLGAGYTLDVGVFGGGRYRDLPRLVPLALRCGVAVALFTPLAPLLLGWPGGTMLMALWLGMAAALALGHSWQGAWPEVARKAGTAAMALSLAALVLVAQAMHSEHYLLPAGTAGSCLLLVVAGGTLALALAGAGATAGPRPWEEVLIWGLAFAMVVPTTVGSLGAVLFPGMAVRALLGAAYLAMGVLLYAVSYSLLAALRQARAARWLHGGVTAAALALAGYGAVAAAGGEIAWCQQAALGLALSLIAAEGVLAVWKAAQP